MNDKICDFVNIAKSFKDSTGRIDIIKLANLLNLQVYSTDEITEAAFIAHDKENNRYEIYVNSKEPRTRQRFSIAHEIAHYLLHKDKICEFGVVGRQNSCSLTGPEEKEADNLASELLMPVDCVNKFLKEHDIKEHSKITDDIVSEISNEFEVSEPVSRIKLRDMDYYVRFA